MKTYDKPSEKLIGDFIGKINELIENNNTASFGENDRLMDHNEVLNFMGIGKTKLWELRSCDRSFPPHLPRCEGERKLLWLKSDIERYVSLRKQGKICKDYYK